MNDEIKKILFEGTPGAIKYLFSFDKVTSADMIVKKFNIWARFFFPNFFGSKDADFHKQMDLYNAKLYLGEIDSFLNICFRGAAKTTRTKLFIAYCIANDIEHRKKYMKILTRDNSNSTQFVTDIYNFLVKPRVKALYPEIFTKDSLKREETMSSFTTGTGVKIKAGTVGMPQRGDIQDENRPDLIVFDDIEDRLSLMSAVITHKIWQNIDEAITGLSKSGGAIYCCNYVSEAGNVHKLVQKIKNKMIIPIEHNGQPTWDRYTIEDIKKIKDSVEDYEGDYLCQPNASKDIYFDRASLEKMPIKQPIRDIAGFKIFKDYNPSHRYAGGHDVAGGVGLDSSTSVFIDFSCMPAQVVGTFASNTILPEAFGDEIVSQANRFGGCLVCPENNKFDQTILKARQLGAKIWTSMGKAIKIIVTTPQTYGWNTNSLSKSNMLSSLREAIESGLIELNDEDLINECKSYTRNDLIDNPVDIRLTTRHFDFVTACFVKGTQILTDNGQRNIEDLKVGDVVLTRDGYKSIIATMCQLKSVIKNIGLTGTYDHPVFCNDNEIKNLQDISKADILYKWNLRTHQIERQSFIMASPITDIQMLKEKLIGFIIWVVLSGKRVLNICIGKFGKIILERYQRVLVFITKIIIKIIILLKILFYYPLVNILNYTLMMSGGKTMCEKGLNKIGIKLIKELGDIIKIKKEGWRYVVFVINHLKHLLITPFFALHYVVKEQPEKEKSKQNKNIFVKFVRRFFLLEFRIKKDAQKNVPHLEEGNVEEVYNIQVADCPEYFANNILVHNCAIAWQMRDHTRPARPMSEEWDVPQVEKNIAI
jgi:hypothetical protein